MKCLGLHNKPTAEMHPGHMLTDPKEEEEEEEDDEKEEVLCQTRTNPGSSNPLLTPQEDFICDVIRTLYETC
jgi:hypothetical protein